MLDIYSHAKPRVAPFCCGEALLAKTEASAKAGKARKLAKRNNLDTKFMKILAFNRLCVRIVLISTLYGLRIYCERFFRLSHAKFKAVNPIILINFNMLCFFCPAKKARVQNFEPHPIIKKWFKNNRFFNLRPDRVKNYEPNPIVSSSLAVFTAVGVGIGRDFKCLKFN